jgi:hypothetical protein
MLIIEGGLRFIVNGKAVEFAPLKLASPAIDATT